MTTQTASVERVIQIETPWGNHSSVEFPNELRELRARFPDADFEDLFSIFMEWDCDIEVATKKFKEHLKWREETMPFDRKELLPLLQLGKSYFYGRSKAGCDVAYFRVGMHDPTTTTAELTVKQILYEAYIQIEQARAEGRYVCIAIVMDRTGSSRKSFDTELMKLLFTQVRIALPYRVTKIVVYHVNTIFRNVLWPIVKIILPERLKKSVCFCNTTEELTKHIALDQIPNYLGGTSGYEWTPPLA